MSGYIVGFYMDISPRDTWICVKKNVQVEFYKGRVVIYLLYILVIYFIFCK